MRIEVGSSTAERKALEAGLQEGGATWTVAPRPGGGLTYHVSECVGVEELLPILRGLARANAAVLEADPTLRRAIQRALEGRRIRYELDAGEDDWVGAGGFSAGQWLDGTRVLDCEDFTALGAALAAIEHGSRAEVGIYWNAGAMGHAVPIVDGRVVDLSVYYGMPYPGRAYYERTPLYRADLDPRSRT